MNWNPLHFWVLSQEVVSLKVLGYRLLYNFDGPDSLGNIRRWETGYMVSYRPDVPAQTYRRLVGVRLEVAPRQGRIGGKDRNQ